MGHLKDEEIARYFELRAEFMGQRRQILFRRRMSRPCGQRLLIEEEMTMNRGLFAALCAGLVLGLLLWGTRARRCRRSCKG